MKRIHSGNLFRFFSANATVTSLPLMVIDSFTVVMDEGGHVRTLTHALKWFENARNTQGLDRLLMEASLTPH